MDGLLIIDKPAGITSHDVVSRVRRILKTKRVGHTGTLDPFATGVMVVVVGKATRLAQFLDKDRKEYLAEIQFGWSTDTGDATGTRKAEGGMQNEQVLEKLADVDWETALSKFRGEIMQTPPMYSAKKVEGKKLYELARKGEEIERKAVRVTIYKLEKEADEFGIPHSTIRLRTVCSAGTYIRTLAEDIGASVGIGAHLIALRRTAAGEFDFAQSITLDDLENMSDPSDALLPVERAVSSLNKHELTEERVEKTRNGLSTRVHVDGLVDGQNLQLVDTGGHLIAIGVYDETEKSIRPKVVLN